MSGESTTLPIRNVQSSDCRQNWDKMQLLMDENVLSLLSFLDGGGPSSEYGGINAIDGGAV